MKNIITLIFLISCSYSEPNDEKNNQNLPHVINANAKNATDSSSPTFDIEVNKDSIFTLTKIYDPESSTYDSSTSDIKMHDFNNWILTQKDALKILNSGKHISGTELDLNYLALPFWYKGEFITNGRKGKFEINAASFVVITFNDSIYYLGCSSKKLRKYFLVPPSE